MARELDGLVPAWKDRCIGYVVIDGEEPCGTAGCYLCSRVPGRAYFAAAWVAPGCRRRGIGRRLVELAKAWAAGHGADYIRLWVDDTNPGAAQFYETLGFQPTGENRPVAPGAADRESSYELRLGGPAGHRVGGRA